MTEWVYLDHAATSAVRPPAVAEAVARYITDTGATPGRGGHRLAVQAGRLVLGARQRVAEVLGVRGGDPGRITFASSATMAINQVLWGTIRPGDRVVVTALDHNAVLRPAERVTQERRGAVDVIAATPDGALDEVALTRSLDGARLLTINGASNVLGTTLDVARLARLARDAGVLTLVDAAQLAGHAPFDAMATGVDMVAFAGHKGLLGPQGIGGLWVRAGVELDPVFAGGTGGDSLSRAMPDSWPDRLEPGTQNGPGIAGLAAGIEAVLREGVSAIHGRTTALKAALHDGLERLPGVRVLSPPAPDGVAIVTVASSVLDPAELAARLDREYGVLTRAGLHCAPETHRLLGTADTGAVRFSMGWSSTAEDVARALDAMAALHRPSQVAGGMPLEAGPARAGS